MDTLNEARWRLLDSRTKQVALASLVAHLRDRSIEPIVIKGWTVARYYPSSHVRNYTDIDLVVHPESLVDAAEALSTATRFGTGFDLHPGIGKLDRVEFGVLYGRSVLVPLEGENIRVLSEEDNLRITATHWLIDGGVYKDRLYDIKYLIEGRRPDFDWNICLNSAGEIRREWVLAAIATTRETFGIDLAGVPPEVVEFSAPRWFTRAMEREWKRGPYLRIPLFVTVRHPPTFFAQFLRRFPPNPIAAMVDVEGKLDGNRNVYQIRSLFQKIRPFFTGLFRKRGKAE